MQKLIEVKNLYKSFDVPDEEFMKHANKLRKIFFRKYVKKDVLIDLSFSVKEGEIVGYIGKNGAGKTTTMKILSGILSPTKGKVRVLGKDPYKNRKELSKEISVVFGNRDVVFFDIPLIDSLKFYRQVYQIPKRDFEDRVEMLARLLNMNDLLYTPLRKMSFGQRRKANVLASFLHSPKLVLLDEPTIGLDIFAKDEVRDFLLEMNRKENTTIILTSHYMEDIEKLANRIILIDNGKIVEDKPYEEIISSLEYKIVILKGEIEKIKNLLSKTREVEIINEGHNILSITVKKEKIKIFFEYYNKGIIEDLEIRNPSLEDILKKVYYNDKRN